MREDIMIYKEKISDSLNFEVCTNERFLSFYLNDNAGNHLINFKYGRIGENLSQEHREVSEDLKKYGVNGSMFLQKVEEFLAIMVNKSEEKGFKHFLINTGQVGVIDWALKNGYHFQDQKQEEKYSQILSGDKEDYEVSDEFKSGNKYGGYIFKKINFNKAEQFFNEELHKSEDRDNIDLRDFTERFELIKDIETKNN
jgi:hypothetical protein